MLRKEDVLRTLDGKTVEEKLIYISQNFNLNWDFTQGPCKIWQAKVFTYCTTNEFEYQLDFFLFLVNLLGFLLGVCFQEEDTVFLGCVGPCGLKQTILYYSITFED
ncbi:hypothetical protein CLNEO_06970 [Anaerotignum neopropionicum]|uniref:Uncharacterized protein n=1 Tax=Anaerotignum neopropionicum TaxID=36847 RepID=A0A136WG14_9FIRM|nr:hypothetical protein [Anaerotignum neopropionicum]KXL53471.1 hypothetical protein CLNEO_06970 [Anaerotignum neopropionicum]